MSSAHKYRSDLFDGAKSTEFGWLRTKLILFGFALGSASILLLQIILNQYPRCRVTIPASASDFSNSQQQQNKPKCEMLCPAGYFYEARFPACFKLLFNVNYYEAQAQCAKLRGVLPSVHSRDENNFVLNFSRAGVTMRSQVNEFSTWWTADYGVLLGGKKQGLVVVWDDGSKFDFENFGHVEYETKAEECFVMLTDKFWPSSQPGTWSDVPCENPIRTAICRVEFGNLL